MKQCPDRDQLELLLNNGLVDTARDELELHVEDCALCQQALETLTDATVCGLEPGPDVLKFVAGAEPGRLIDPLRATAVATAAADKRGGQASYLLSRDMKSRVSWAGAEWGLSTRRATFD